MIRGLYTSASGMMAWMDQHEVQLHNLANLQTIGYKADATSLQDFPSILLARVDSENGETQVGRTGTGVEMSELMTDFSEGPLEQTDNPFDFAIGGQGFFQIQTEEGIRYTRDGRFHRDAEGNLVTSDGAFVLGANGPIVLPEGELTLSSTGELFVNDELVEQLSLVRFADTADLVKSDGTTFINRGAAPEVIPAQEISVQQGYLEGSNVDPTTAITSMMSVVRAYQISQRMVQLQDQVTSKSVNELGRI